MASFLTSFLAKIVLHNKRLSALYQNLEKIDSI